METLGIKEMAEILKKSRYSIATDVTKSPHKLPPRLMLPGNRRVLWLKSDVEKWINSHRLVPVSELISK